MMSINAKVWLSAFRLRTLPLALASILVGIGLAFNKASFKWSIAILAITTTVLLQILSNLANDYGDTINGADSHNRIGPQRTVQAGLISLQSMKIAIIIFALLSLISGIALLVISFKNIGFNFMLFFSIGVLAIIAALKYTTGSKPYGYYGLGDVSVFIFFGWIGVLGTYYVLCKTFELYLLLPASSFGMMATMVLNLNNMRDIESDAYASKKTIPVRIGLNNAKLYHYLLSLTSFFLILLYVLFFQFKRETMICLLVFPLFMVLNFKIQNLQNAELDRFLKPTAMLSLLFSLLFAIGINI